MNESPDWKVGYGYQFWVSRHGYRGDGAAGQLAVVLEQEGISIAVNSCLSNMQNLLDIIWEELLPELKSAPLPENPEAYRQLENFISNLEIPAVPSTARPDVSPAGWDFQDNPAGIRRAEISFGKDSCTLSFTTPRGKEELHAGFGHYEDSILQLTDSIPHPVAACARWREPWILEIRSLIRDGIFRDIWTIHFDDEHEPLKNQAICSCFRPGKPRLFVR